MLMGLISKFFGSKVGGVVGALSITILVILGAMFLYYKNKAARLETENIMLRQNLISANLQIIQSDKDKTDAIKNLDAYIRDSTEMDREHAIESDNLNKALDRKTIENQDLKKQFLKTKMNLDDLTATLANLDPGEDPGPLKQKIADQQAALDRMREIIANNDCLKARIPDEIFKVLCEGCQ